jgi:uncharacterized protein
MKRLLFSIILLLSGILFAQVSTIENLPNPKTQSEANYVSNPDGILSPEAVSNVNAMLRTLEDTTTAEIAVVVVQSIGSSIPKEFATELFNYWGIGKKHSNNGLLILLVIDQRRMEFETGFGMEPILTDAICKRIQVEYMVPFAKASNYDGAITSGVEQVVKILIDPVYRNEISANTEVIYAEKPFHRKPVSLIPLAIGGFIYSLITLGNLKGALNNLKKKPAYIKNHLTEQYLYTKYFLLNFALPTGVAAYQYMTGYFRIGEILLFAYCFIALLLLEKRLRYDKYLKKESENKTAYEKYNLYNSAFSGWGAAAFFIPLPFLFSWLINKYRKRKLRNTPPAGTCSDMMKLDERADDAHLEMFQITEETLKTVDYDVWKCKDNEKITILRYPNKQTKYSACPNCKAITFFVSEKHTITSATYDHSGTGEKIYLCKFCNHKKSETYTIPKLTRSSSSSGSGGGGGGGGGFGGGGSGGGGAGSSW